MRQSNFDIHRKLDQIKIAVDYGSLTNLCLSQVIISENDGFYLVDGNRTRADEVPLFVCWFFLFVSINGFALDALPCC